MKTFYYILIVVLGVTFFVSPVKANTFYMTPEGAGSKNGSDWANALPSPTATITVASGDTYYLQVGTYQLSSIGTTGHFFNITSGVSNVLIEGGFTGNGLEKSSSEKTILNGDNSADGNHRFVQVGDYILSNVVVKGIVFQNRNSAATTQGGAVLTRPGISFEDCVFKNNATSHNNANQTSGAAVCISESKSGTVNFTHCQFIGNAAITGTNSKGAAIGVGANATSANVLTVNIDNCLFDGNSAYYGGAIYVKLAIHQVNITNSVFVNNTSNASGNGGAVYIFGGTTTVTNSIFYNNKKGTTDNNIYGTVTKSKTLEILPPLGLTIDISAYSDGVPADGQITIPYTINTSFTTPVAASLNGGASTTIAASPYSMTINDNTSLYLSATPQIPVTVVEGTHSNATITGLTPSGTALSTDYPISGTVTAASGYHAPYVSINGIYVPVASDGSFTYNPVITAQTTFTVTATAYPLNVFPVKSDTYISSQTETGNTVPAKDLSPLFVQGSNDNTYVRRSFIEFNMSGIDVAAYNEVKFALTYHSVQYTARPTSMYANTVTTENTQTLDNLTWSNSGNQTNIPSGITISAEHPIDVATVSNGTQDSFELFYNDIKDLINASSDGIIRLQLNTTYGASGGNNIKLHSLENGNADYVPQLVFKYNVVSGYQNHSISGFSAYGNSQGQIVIDKYTSTSEIATIFNLQGQKITGQQLEKGKTIIKQGLNAGVYIVKVGNEITKVVVK